MMLTLYYNEWEIYYINVLLFQLPPYEPPVKEVRPFIFPLDLKLSPEDIRSVITDIYTPLADPAPNQTAAENLISEICDVQSSQMVPDW